MHHRRFPPRFAPHTAMPPGPPRHKPPARARTALRMASKLRRRCPCTRLHIPCEFQPDPRRFKNAIFERFHWQIWKYPTEMLAAGRARVPLLRHLGRTRLGTRAIVPRRKHGRARGLKIGVLAGTRSASSPAGAPTPPAAEFVGCRGKARRVRGEVYRGRMGCGRYADVLLDVGGRYLRCPAIACAPRHACARAPYPLFPASAEECRTAPRRRFTSDAERCRLGGRPAWRRRHPRASGSPPTNKSIIDGRSGGCCAFGSRCRWAIQWAVTT